MLSDVPVREADGGSAWRNAASCCIGKAMARGAGERRAPGGWGSGEAESQDACMKAREAVGTTAPGRVAQMQVPVQVQVPAQAKMPVPVPEPGQGQVPVQVQVRVQWPVPVSARSQGRGRGAVVTGAAARGKAACRRAGPGPRRGAVAERVRATGRTTCRRAGLLLRRSIPRLLKASNF